MGGAAGLSAGEPRLGLGTDLPPEPPIVPLTAADLVDQLVGSLGAPVDGRCVFLTTNHEEKLPAPLLKLVDEAGRRVKFKDADLPAMQRLWRQFYRQKDLDAVRTQAWRTFKDHFVQVHGQRRFSHSAMQGYLMRFRLDPLQAAALENVQGYIDKDDLSAVIADRAKPTLQPRDTPSPPRETLSPLAAAPAEG